MNHFCVLHQDSQFYKNAYTDKISHECYQSDYFIAWSKFLKCQKIYKDKEASSRKEKERLLEEIVLRNHDYTIIFLIFFFGGNGGLIYII